MVLFVDESGIYAEVQLTCTAEDCDEVQKRKIVRAILSSPGVKKPFPFSPKEEGSELAAWYLWPWWVRRLGPVGSHKYLVCLSASKYHVINVFNVREHVNAEFQARMARNLAWHCRGGGRWSQNLIEQKRLF